MFFFFNKEMLIYKNWNWSFMKANKGNNKMNFEDQNLRRLRLLIHKKWIIMNGKFLICLIFFFLLKFIKI